jgi:peptidoglycan L-alanyl-D-glutamate endopeptidase CwlK
MSRELNDLNPEFSLMVDPFLANCKAAGIDLLITCTARTNEEQAVLYAQGRTTPGRIVTNAKPGQSAHNYGLAIDVVPIVHGKPDWSGDSPIWQEIGTLGQARGMQWLGAPDSQFREQAHFQHPQWKTIAGVT